MRDGTSDTPADGPRPAAVLDKAGTNQPNRNGLVGCAIAQTRKPALSARLRRRGDVLRKLHTR